jgi:hypothetical protein
VNLTIEFQYTFEEFVEGIKAINANARKNFSIRGWLLFIAIAIVLFVLLEENSSPPSQVRTLGERLRLPSALFLLWVVVFIVIRLVRRKTYYRRAFDQQADLHFPQMMRFTDDGVESSNSVTQGKTAWCGYLKFGETANLFLLYIGPNLAMLVPKRAFPGASEVESFRTYASSRISARQSAFPVLPPKAG